MDALATHCDRHIDARTAFYEGKPAYVDPRVHPMHLSSSVHAFHKKCTHIRRRMPGYTSETCPYPSTPPLHTTPQPRPETATTPTSPRVRDVPARSCGCEPRPAAARRCPPNPVSAAPAPTCVRQDPGSSPGTLPPDIAAACCHHGGVAGGSASDEEETAVDCGWIICRRDGGVGVDRETEQKRLGQHADCSKCMIYTCACVRVCGGSALAKEIVHMRALWLNRSLTVAIALFRTPTE